MTPEEFDDLVAAVYTNYPPTSRHVKGWALANLGVAMHLMTKNKVYDWGSDIIDIIAGVFDPILDHPDNGMSPTWAYEYGGTDWGDYDDPQCCPPGQNIQYHWCKRFGLEHYYELAYLRWRNQ